MGILERNIPYEYIDSYGIQTYDRIHTLYITIHNERRINTYVCIY